MGEWIRMMMKKIKVKSWGLIGASVLGVLFLGLLFVRSISRNRINYKSFFSLIDNHRR